MTPVAPPSHRLTALAHLARTAVKPRSAAELGQGLSVLRARTTPGTPSTAPSLVLGWAFVAALGVASLLLCITPYF